MLPKEDNGPSLRERIKLLASLKIRPKEIAEILGRNPKHISKELSGLRKENNKKHEQEK